MVKAQAVACDSDADDAEDGPPQILQQSFALDAPAERGGIPGCVTRYNVFDVGGRLVVLDTE